MDDWRDELEVRWSEMVCNHPRIFNAIPTVTRWVCLTLAPVVLGIYASALAKAYILDEVDLSVQQVFSPPGLQHLGPVVFMCGVSVVGQLWHHDNHKKNVLSRLLYESMRWLYIDLGFAAKRRADVRCTLWAPINSRATETKLRLVQLVDYVPTYEQDPAETTGNELRKNKNSGRIIPVARIVAGKVRPVGIVGLCVVKSLRDHKANMLIETIQDNQDFYERMTGYWNFTETRARRLTPDRRSYISIALMDAGCTDVLGVIFMDSRLPDTFSPRTAQRAQRHLPGIATLLAEKE